MVCTQFVFSLLTKNVISITVPCCNAYLDQINQSVNHGTYIELPKVRTWLSLASKIIKEIKKKISIKQIRFEISFEEIQKLMENKKRKDIFRAVVKWARPRTIRNGFDYWHKKTINTTSQAQWRTCICLTSLVQRVRL